MKGLRYKAGIFLMIFLVNSLSVFAQIHSGTVVIGNSGYSLEYVNNENNQMEIKRCIEQARIAKQNIYVKDNSGRWFSGETPLKNVEENLPWVIYQKRRGVFELFEKGDGEKMEMGNFFVEDGNRIQEIHTDEDIFLKEKRILLKNCTVDGTIFIDAGSDGEVILENVKAKKIGILSGGVQRIEFINVKADELLIDGISPVTVAAKPGTRIENTIIKSKALLEERGGDFWNIEISMNDNEQDKSVEMRGLFSGKVTVKSGVNLTVPFLVGIRKLEIEPENNEERINFSGRCNKVTVSRKADIALDTAYIGSITAKAELKLNIDQRSILRKIHHNNNEVVIVEGDDRIGYDMDKYSEIYVSRESNEPSVQPEPTDPTGPLGPGEYVFAGIGDKLIVKKGIRVFIGKSFIFSVNTTPGAITWESSNSDVVEVDDKGIIFAKELGEAEIHGTLEINGIIERGIMYIKVWKKITDELLGF